MRRVAALVVVAVALTGCVRLPESGPVRDVPEGTAATPSAGIPYLPPGPARGADRAAVVRGFLDAMMASPVQLSTAREFLTAQAAEAWHPERRIVVYAGSSMPHADQPGVIDLEAPVWLDARGRWRGPLPPASRRVELPIVQQQGEWRIAAAPDGLLVHTNWFVQGMTQADLFFPEPSGRVLVPEPVFVPRGDQLATSLVRGLLAGPTDAAAGLLQPLAGASLVGGAVTVEDGVASVNLTGPLADLSREERRLAIGQLAWTLRQVPGLRSFRVQLGAAPVTVDGQTEIPIGTSRDLDPAVVVAPDALFGLSQGVPVRLDRDGAVRLAGPFVRGPRLEAIAPDLGGTSAAGVTADHHRILVGPFDDAAELRVVARGAALDRPAWDVGGRLWVLDRTARGAHVSVVVEGRRRTVPVPGVSGHDVARLLVSRDGTRLVAAVGGSVVVARIDWTTGAPVAGRPRVVARTNGREIVDLAWHRPTELLALVAAGTGSEVVTVSVDGAPQSLRGGVPADRLRARLTRLVGSPAEGSASWGVTSRGDVLEVGGFSSSAPPAGATGLDALTYAG